MHRVPAGAVGAADEVMDDGRFVRVHAISGQDGTIQIELANGVKLERQPDELVTVHRSIRQ